MKTAINLVMHLLDVFCLNQGFFQATRFRSSLIQAILARQQQHETQV
ncbi:hypothetical protein [Dapis sp. BLCC M229]